MTAERATNFLYCHVKTLLSRLKTYTYNLILTDVFVYLLTVNKKILNKNVSINDNRCSITPWRVCRLFNGTHDVVNMNEDNQLNNTTITSVRTQTASPYTSNR